MFDDPSFVQKLEVLADRYDELTSLLSDPEIHNNRSEFLKLTKEHSDVGPLVAKWREYKQLEIEITDAEQMVDSESDPELKEMAKEEVKELESGKTSMQQEIKILLLPKDPNDAKNILLELRAGTGGDEAALFAGDLMRMYLRYAERNAWKIQTMSLSEGSAGGIKEAVLLIEGKNVYSSLKFESGVHRVQRVPQTESQGRVHTSAATVAVMPEAEDVDVKLEEKDLRIDVYRSSGPGGQSVNTTDSAVRIVHIPTGIKVICQDEKSQHKNKAKAMKILRSRILDAEIAKKEAVERDARRSMVGSGDRSEKIRTYNFPQDRVTDHRISLTKRNLTGILDGDLASIIDALRAHEQAELLKAHTQ